MTDTSVQILAKGCEKTGITDDLAEKLYHGGANKILAIVEFSVAKEHLNRNTGKQSVDLSIDILEPVVDGTLNGTFVEHVRTLQAALQQNRLRQENGDQLPLEGDKVGPSNADLITQGDALVERNELAEPIGIFSGKKS